MGSKQPLADARVYVASARMISAALGSGVFAARPLRPGETVVLLSGRLINFAMCEADDPQAFPNAMEVSPNTYIEPPEGHPSRYLNHSCEPNAIYCGRRAVVALRPITADEQVTIDYSTTESDPRWQLAERCECGSATCRGTIRAVQSLTAEQFAAYRRHLIPHLRDAYLAAHPDRLQPIRTGCERAAWDTSRPGRRAGHSGGSSRVAPDGQPAAGDRWPALSVSRRARFGPARGRTGRGPAP